MTIEKTDKTPLSDFLLHVLGCYIKTEIENEINEKIDDEFFHENYMDSVGRWSIFNHSEGAHSLYQEAVEEIKSDWWVRNSKLRNSKLRIDVAKEIYDEMDEDDRKDFLEFICNRTDDGSKALGI